MKHYIGIDVSKNRLDIAWLKDADKLKFKFKTKVFKSDHSDYAALIDWLI